MGISLSKAASWLVGPQSVFKNVVISGGQFIWTRTVHFIQAGPRRGLKLLARRVVPSAMHDSAQRVDPPRCHPNTRDAILEEVFQWIINSEDRELWLLWINGAAGAGKSAITQSIAEICVKEKIAVASFFFSKTDSRRDNAGGLVATLAYQLIQQIPQTTDDITRIIEQDPLIFEKSLESQVKELILNPLVHVRHLLGRHFILVIDGIDECHDINIQCNLIQGITSLLRAGNLPVIFIIASRLEPVIVASFKALQKATPSVLMKLSLDNIPDASNGIRNFLNDKFAELKVTHHIGHQIPENWPLSSVVERIIAKSSGQFIYASLVVKFVSSPRSNPIKQLEIIDGIRSSSPSKQPFTHLDELYRAIFSQIESDDLDMVLNVIAYALLTGEKNIAVIDWAFQLVPGDIETILSDLAAVITCCSDETCIWPSIRFLHASLSDFLLDRNRSGEYHINAEEYTIKLAYIVLSQSPIKSAYPSIIQLLKTAQPLAEIRHALLQFDPKFEDLGSTESGYVPYMFSILRAVKNLNFDDPTVYHRFLDLLVGYFETQSNLDHGVRSIFLEWKLLQELEHDLELHDLLSRLSEACISVLPSLFEDTFTDDDFSFFDRFQAPRASILSA